MSKVLVVTGGGRGIGAATCRMAAQRGYAVCVNYVRNREAADQVVAECDRAGAKAIAVQADVAVETDVVRLFETVDRALVIDDNFDVAESMTWMLEGLAREIKMVHSGQAALDRAPQFRPELIVCDIGMPGMDGYETCRRLRQVPGMEKTLIAAVSGYGNEEDRRKSKEAGFDRHLVKPIGRATLEELVRSAAGG